MSLANILDDFATSQAMIDINTGHLDGLRTQCELTAELTQIEIRTLESKLVKLFGKQLVARQKAIKENCVNVPSPNVRKWLGIVGLSNETSEAIIDNLGEDFNQLMSCSESQIKEIMHKIDSRDEELRRIITAMKNLKAFIEKAILNDSSANEMDLHWDSWDNSVMNVINNESDFLNNVNVTHLNKKPYQSQNTLMRSCPTSPPSNISSNSPNSSFSSNSHYSPISSSSVLSPKDRKTTPPSTPPLICKNKSNSQSNFKDEKKFPSTPPSNRKHQTNLLIDPNSNSLTKSKSHEEHLSNRIEPVEGFLHTKDSVSKKQRRRLATEPLLGHSSFRICSPNRSPPVTSPDQQLNDSCFDEPTSSGHYNPTINLIPPRSPRSHGGMMHVIHHRFVNVIKITTVMCHLCEKPMIFGFKCKECKYRCHRECVNKVPPSCGLPSELVNIFKEKMKNRAINEFPLLNSSNSQNTSLSYAYSSSQQSQTPHMLRMSKIHLNKKKAISSLPFGAADSSSNTSSCNSSSPSSPALITNQNNHHRTPPSSSKKEAFHFPEVSKDPYGRCSGSVMETTATQKSNDSDKTFSGNSGSTSSDKTVAFRIDSLDSQISDYDQNDRAWPRQNSLTMREWDIPFDELKKEKEIGTGRFGTVFKGNWHGSVAIKMFNMSNALDDRKALEAFKLEVATFRKTRHENLVLFMGACMKPPHLAIVTSYCKGLPLYCHIHERKEKFNLNRMIGISLQISQGMGYLHARGIIHKDLKSKNIFYDNNNNKVTITDFGLFSLAKLCFNNNKNKHLIQIPKGWLCYLAPELVKALKFRNGQDQDDLPFSFKTDVFSFGTVWHELVSGSLPFKSQPAEVIIWQVGKGIKQSLINLQASKEIKDILMLCWAYKAHERPDFAKLVDVLTNLPKKRLQRSPSHPTHLLRSLESLF